MRRLFFLGVMLALAWLTAAPFIETGTAQSDSARELAGVWEAKRRFGPDIRGTLLLRQSGNSWQAEIAGHLVQAKLDEDVLTFELADGKGTFRGEFDARRTKIAGYWTQPRGFDNGPLASPVTLTRYGRDGWRGEVVPLDDTITFYLFVKPREDGTVGAFLRNPERNLGWLRYRIDYLERTGESVKFFAANKGAEKGRMVAEGIYREGVLTINSPLRGGSYDFRRLDETEASNFYPRGRPVAAYTYRQPPAMDDGWPTATLEEVGLSRASVEKFIQMLIETPVDSVNAQEDHAVLIARHGKLVLEEYFHGENREKPHDTRSASKSVAADLVGAAMYAGVAINPNSAVYSVMNNGEFPPELEPRKRALTLEHLLTMSSGYDCDEGSTDSAGFEDNMWDQSEEPDFYKWTLALKMVREPGEKGVYCSAGSNLVGGVVARAARERTQDLFRRLLADPLQIKRYHLPLSPAGDYTMTGGAKFLPRDFMKLGQVHLNGGTWKGRRIYTQEWSRRSTSHHINVGKGMYGYLWWVKDYPYKGRNLRAFFAAGNGGQIVMAIPELEMVLAFYAGNYNDAGGFKAQNVYVPQYILPAVEK